MKIMRVITVFLIVVLCAAPALAMTDYAEPNNWAFCETDVAEGPVDVFFVPPTATTGSEEKLYFADFNDEVVRPKFIGGAQMLKGLFDHDARFFAPFYHQMFVMGYYQNEAKKQEMLDNAYSDVKDAFRYYLENYNDGRPFILAGFSQGSDMCIRLMKDFMQEDALRSRLIACYAIGWRLTQDEIDAFPWLDPAQTADDLGKIVCFSTEADFITGSIVVPEGMKSYSINPLTWRCDGEIADRSLNRGACFLTTDGEITQEIPAFTGAYIDPERGTLIATDVTSEEYPARLYGVQEGVYHIYDYQFFYRNIEENVQTRIASYLEKNESAAAA